MPSLNAIPFLQMNLGSNLVPVQVTCSVKYSSVETCLAETCRTPVGFLHCKLFGRDSSSWNPDDLLFTFPTIPLFADPSGASQETFATTLPTAVLNEDPSRRNPGDEISATVWLYNDLWQWIQTTNSNQINGLF